MSKHSEQHSELDEQVKEFALDIWHLALDEGYGTEERRAKLVEARRAEFVEAIIELNNRRAISNPKKLEAEL